MASHRTSALWVLVLIVASAISAQSSDRTKSKTLTPAGSETQLYDYVIGPEDALVVNVWKEPELTRNVSVRPDGKISLPLIGDVVASGRTPTQLQHDITRQLQQYIANPEVAVIVQEAKSQKFNILGEVEHPGLYVLSRSMTVLGAIAVAGGFRDFAKTSKIYVLRVGADGAHERIPFNYKQVIKGNQAFQDVELKPGDIVVVP